MASAGGAPGAPAAAPPTTSVAETRPGTFEIHVQGADLRGVLQLLSTQGRVNIIATKEVTGTVTADLYGVTFDEALNAVMMATGFVYERKGNFIYVFTQEQKAKMLQAARKTEVRIFPLSYVTAADAKVLIAPALSADATVALTPASAVGISESSTDAGGLGFASRDALVINDYAENLDRVAAILQELDVKPDQVLIKATLLRATLTEDNALGMEFNMLSGIDFESMAATSPGLQSMATGDVTGTALDVDAGATFRTDLNAGIGAGGLTIGFLNNETAFFIRALENVTDVTVLANPQLLVINKMRGEVMIGNRDGYLTTTVTETVATQSVQFLETGTRLVVRPYIARDGYIRMEVHPEDSSGSVAQVGNNVLPSETTTEVTSNILVRDGHTIVIGGLFRERTSNGRSQVPLLGNIPYLGAAFRRTQDNTTREEVIALITPRVIKQDADEATSAQIADDTERFRAGQRKGLRWWGRPRLAETYLRWAKQHLRNGRRDRALWDLDMVLSLEPRMIEAIELKERLTQRAYWADQARHSSAKYIVERMMMQEMGKPVERVIPPRKPRDAAGIDEEVRKAFQLKPRPVDPLLGPATLIVPGGLKEEEGGPGADVPPTGVAGPSAPADDQVPGDDQATGDDQAAGDDTPISEVIGEQTPGQEDLGAQPQAIEELVCEDVPEEDVPGDEVARSEDGDGAEDD